MADNTGPTTQENTQPVNTEKDMNHISFEKGKSYGCETGHHEFSVQGAQVEVGEDGLTAMKLTCVLCGVKTSIEANLNVNDLIQKYDSDISGKSQNPGQMPGTPIQPQPIPQQANPTPAQQMQNGSNDELWKKLMGK